MHRACQFILLVRRESEPYVRHRSPVKRVALAGEQPPAALRDAPCPGLDVDFLGRVCPQRHAARGRRKAQHVAQLAAQQSGKPVAPCPVDPPGALDVTLQLAALEQARRDTGLDEAAVTGTGIIGGHRVAVIATEFEFLAGSVGLAARRRVIQASDRAVTIWDLGEKVTVRRRSARSNSTVTASTEMTASRTSGKTMANSRPNLSWSA